MGRDIPNANFTEADFRDFKQRLREESLLLMDWFKNGVFEPGQEKVGFELEMWLVDSCYLPSPTNEPFLDRVASHLVVPELSKFNFEINSTPHPLSGHLLNHLEKELHQVWDKCQAQAQALDSQILAIGILPTIQDEMLTLEHMSSLKRYYALNQQVFRLREGKPIEVEIQGKDSLHLKHKDVMLEAAATSLQIHLQVHPAEAVRQYNIAQILSAPMVAVAANSPYLFGRDLWDETRIPTFEQAVSVASFRDHRGTLIERVTFGTGYGRFSLMEPFLENLDGFPILLPLVFDEDPSWLSHLRLHNGTIWRWNRPLIGIDDRGKPHLRIEHRVAAAGPSIPDIVANIAFYLGMVNFFVRSEPALDQRISFETARKNFYQAARDGWDATLQWVDGKAYPLRTLLEETLLPAARDGLKRADINSADISRYIDDIMTSRIRTGQNGARWQRAFIQAHGRDFAELTHAYHTNQRRHIPVHEWTI